jgi:simple sugar transport system permease protein
MIYKTKFGSGCAPAASIHRLPTRSASMSTVTVRRRSHLRLLGGIGGLAFTIAAGSGFESSVAGYGFCISRYDLRQLEPVRIFGAALFFALFRVIGNYSSSIPLCPAFPTLKAPVHLPDAALYRHDDSVIFTSKKSRARRLKHTV